MSSVDDPLLVKEEPPLAERVSLFYSVTILLTRVLPVTVAVVAFGVVAQLGVVIGGAAVGLLVSLFATDRRVDLDADGLTFVPLLPLRTPQHVPFDAVGPFVMKARTGLARGSNHARAEIVSGMKYRQGGLFGRDHVDIRPVYALSSYRAQPLPLDELMALIERYRSAGSS